MASSFPWNLLPRLGRAEARAANLCAVLFGAREVAIDVQGIGAVTATLTRVTSHRGATFRPELGVGWCTNFALPGVTGAGILALDDSLARGLVGHILGEPTGEVLTDWDWGLILWTVLEGWSRTQRSRATNVTLVGDRRPPARVAEVLVGPAPVVEMVFAVRADAVSGTARLFLTESLFAQLEPASADRAAWLARDDAVGAIEVRVALSVGRARLSKRERNELAPGDVVLFPEHALTLSGGGPAKDTAARAIVDGVFFPAECAHEDKFLFTIAGGAQPLTGRAQMSSDDATTQLTDHASLELEAVIGRATLTFGDLARLSPGQVLVSDRDVGEPCDLVANGKTIARGELVDVEGRLGLRITSILR